MQMMMFQNFHIEETDDDFFSIDILKLQMMVIRYSHTEDTIGHTYDADDDVLNIHILKMQMMMVQYLPTEDANDKGSVFTY